MSLCKYWCQDFWLVYKHFTNDRGDLQDLYAKITLEIDLYYWSLMKQAVTTYMYHLAIKTQYMYHCLEMMHARV